MLLNIFAVPCIAQSYDANKVFPVDSLREDFSVLRKVLEEAHIGLYRYSSKKTIDSLMDAQFAKVNRPMTELDFFRIINPVMTGIRDEHTFLMPSVKYWNSEIGQTVYTGNTSPSTAKLFPFFIKIIKNRIFIDNNLSADANIPDGTEILAINGKTAAEVLQILLPTIHTNGFVETFRYRNLEQFSLQQTYNRFMVNYALFIEKPEAFHLAIKKPGSAKKETVVINALTSKDIYNYYWRRYSAINDVKKRTENPIEFKAINAKTAYLRLSDFHDNTWRKYNLSYSTEYRNDFSFLKANKTENLIIDLRNNEGGNLGIGMDLLQYILTSSYRPYNYHECINYRYPQFQQYLRDPNAITRFPDSVFITTASNTFRSNPQVKTETWSRPMQPVSNPYKGKIYILINGATGSAASIFATLIRVNRKDAVFVGEEGGGDMEGPVSGGGMDIFLPHTKIRADIPFIKRVVNLNGYPHQPGRGIIPDYSVSTTVDDMVGKRDTQLNFVLGKIGK
jgi:hypothetical protein